MTFFSIATSVCLVLVITHLANIFFCSQPSIRGLVLRLRLDNAARVFRGLRLLTALAGVPPRLIAAAPPALLDTVRHQRRSMLFGS